MKKIILLLAIVVIAVLLAFMSLPEDPGRQSTVSPEQAGKQAEEDAQASADNNGGEQTTVKTMEDARLEALKAEYAKLERARRNLRQRLQNVAYYLREAELPEAEGGDIRDDLNSANRLLINPPLLGAFNGIDGVRDELKRLERTNQQLDAHEQTLREHGAGDDSGN
ncbi:uncharacterized protein YxeA [Methylohalomonas lacus]|uniref:Uncharacterized protein YxeA n=1 Tax=Methylohalomonas lacus TaxID=398773 RepID=A0AAE3L0R3_9GAMM|nr:hypothetical protein [Methylohalomonas lacus]MCS3902485.1 uncharacterized protein YxeA [Methylohalomonas lacus]